MGANSSTLPVLSKRQHFWLEHYRACNSSGHSYRGYAKNHGLNPNTFSTMIRRLRRLGAIEQLPEAGAQLFKKIPLQPNARNFQKLDSIFQMGFVSNSIQILMMQPCQRFCKRQRNPWCRCLRQLIQPNRNRQGQWS
ncbi:MAG: hypothetical protein HQL69_22965 [Magnetococcales bacterium]|nr:hypothetical protein [Magnetococcales bacterium]